MDLIIKGAIAGLTLSFLIGPVFFTLIQTGVEKGFRAGVALCSGIWMSDVLIILFAYMGLSYILLFTQWNGFRPWVGSLGGIILIIFGLSSLLTRTSSNQGEMPASRRSDYMTLSVKGFVINTFNPFTIIFWLGLMSTIIAESARTSLQASQFFGALLIVMISFDVLKVLLAKRIRGLLNPGNIQRFRQIAGICLVVFGIVLLCRTWL